MCTCRKLLMICCFLLAMCRSSSWRRTLKASASLRWPWTSLPSRWRHWREQLKSAIRPACPSPRVSASPPDFSHDLSWREFGECAGFVGMETVGVVVVGGGCGPCPKSWTGWISIFLVQWIKQTTTENKYKNKNCKEGVGTVSVST